MQQPTTIDDLTEDSRFEIIKNLDYQSIENLCNSNKLFRSFCVSFEGDIYKYLLQRDYGVASQRDTAKYRYLQAINVQKLTLKSLRANGITIFADMLELEFLINPTGPIHQLFTEPAGRVIIAPTDTTITQYVNSVRYLSETDFYDRFNTLFVENHAGTLKWLRFTNLNGLIFTMPPPNGTLIPLSNISGLQLYSTDQAILSADQHAAIRASFYEERDYDEQAIYA